MAAGCGLFAQGPQDAQALHRDAFVMDGHVHMINRQLYLGGKIGDRYPDGQVDLPRMREGEIDAFFMSLYVEDSYYPNRYETKHAFRLMELALEQIATHSDQIEVARSGADIGRINRAGKVAAVLDLEGNFDLDGDLLLLRALHRLGLRSAMLPAHNSANNFADSCCAAPRFGGLNNRGREMVREMNRLGMVINVAHGSNETILQAVKESRHPVLFSHGGFRHFVEIDRSLSDEAARAIASRGGVIGIHLGNSFSNPVYYEWRQRQRVVESPWNASRPKVAPDPVGSIEELTARTAKRYPIEPAMAPAEVMMEVDQILKVIDYAIGLVGEDHVSLGIDFDGGVEPPKGIKDISDLPKLTEAFLRHGYSEERIRTILGGNLLRLFHAVTEK
jgi:membrane dipeptidase